MTSSTTTADSKRQNVEAIFPLLPMQQALYFRRELAGHDDPGFLQVRAMLDGPVDTCRLSDSWDVVASRHSVLRMSCRTRAEGDPLLVVWKSAPTPIVELDWREHDDHSGRLDAFLAADRHQGLDLGEEPAHRITLIRTGDDCHQVVWTCHHIFVDGWSSAQVLNEWIEIYGQLGNGPVVAASRRTDNYRAYYNWAANRDKEHSRRFWSDHLTGFRNPERLTTNATNPGSNLLSRPLGQAVTQGVLNVASSLKITPNAVLQGAWAILLGRLLNRSDVVFGVTVSGRAAPVDGIDSLVANVANLVPVRANLPEAISTQEWLVGLRDQQFESQPFQDSFLSDIQAWSGITGGQPLFETMLVVESFPTIKQNDSAAVALRDFRSDITTTIPLTLAVLLGQEWALQLKYDTAYIDDARATEILDTFQVVLASMAQDPINPSPRARSNSLDIAPLTTTTITRGSSRESPGHVEPRDTLESLLQGIWQRTLGVAQLGITDNYFDLGGTSILAVRLFAEIERVLGPQLPLATLLEAATVQDLAAVMRDGVANEWECLTPIQAKGTRPPLICVHAGDLHVLFYRHLANHLGDDQPVYGLEPVGLRSDRAPLETIEAMAAAYVAELQSLFPQGPYRLLGDCLGGAVALEVARQLEAAGAIIDALVVCDAGLPQDRTRWRLASRAWETMRDAGPAEVVARTRAKLQKRLTGARAAPRQTVAQLGTQKVKAACNRAYVSYAPGRCQVPITLIRSSDAVERWGDEIEGRWSLLTPRLDVEVIDVRHSAMFHKDQVHAVAKILQPLLAADYDNVRTTNSSPD